MKSIVLLLGAAALTVGLASFAPQANAGAVKAGAKVVAKTANGAAYLGWQAGRHIGKRQGLPDAGKYPGFNRAVVQPTLRKFH